LREVIEGCLLQQVPAQDGGVGDRRPDRRDLRCEPGETVPDQVRDAVREKVAYCAEGSSKALDAVVGVAILARRLVVDSPGRAEHGFGVELVGNAQPRTEGIPPGFAKALRGATDARDQHGARQAARGGIRTSWAEVRVVLVPLFLGHRYLIAQSEV